jgi:hypothetical protein
MLLFNQIQSIEPTATVSNHAPTKPKIFVVPRESAHTENMKAHAPET